MKIKTLFLMTALMLFLALTPSLEAKPRKRDPYGRSRKQTASYHPGRARGKKPKKIPVQVIPNDPLIHMPHFTPRKHL